MLSNRLKRHYNIRQADTYAAIDVVVVAPPPKQINSPVQHVYQSRACFLENFVDGAKKNLDSTRFDNVPLTNTPQCCQVEKITGCAHLQGLANVDGPYIQESVVISVGKYQ
jgi:hypothetical protein